MVTAIYIIYIYIFNNSTPKVFYSLLSFMTRIYASSSAFKTVSWVVVLGLKFGIKAWDYSLLGIKHCCLSETQSWLNSWMHIYLGFPCCVSL